VACSQATVHPGVGKVDAAFAATSKGIDAINAAAAGMPYTIEQAHQLAELHARRWQQVQALTLKAADRRAVDLEASRTRTYDEALLAYTGDRSLTNASALEAAYRAQHAALDRMNKQFRAKPTWCPSV
jgi:hypothetical protein